jgi:hypothetical protein
MPNYEKLVIPDSSESLLKEILFSGALAPLKSGEK